MIRRAADDDNWDVYTRDPVFKHLLERRGWDVVEDHQGCWRVRLPRKAITVRSKSDVERPVSDQTRRNLGQKTGNGILGKESAYRESQEDEMADSREGEA